MEIAVTAGLLGWGAGSERLDGDGARAERARGDLHVDDGGLVAGEGALECGIEVSGLLDPFTVSSAGFDDLVVARVLQGGGDDSDCPDCPPLEEMATKCGQICVASFAAIVPAAALEPRAIEPRVGRGSIPRAHGRTEPPDPFFPRTNAKA